MLDETSALWAAVGFCVIAAALEGLCAGSGVRAFFTTLRFPRCSAPLWAWSIIGAAYYLIFGFVLFRLLNAVGRSPRTIATLTLIVGMMLGNALSNLVIFRMRNLNLSHLIGCAFAGLDGLLFWLVLQLDRLAAISLAPYLVYRVYALWWGYALAKLNTSDLESLKRG